MSAIVDSGAEVNIVGEQWLPSVSEESLGVVIRSLTGQELAIRGMEEVRMDLEDNYSLKIQAAVVRSSKALILGIPFLKQVQAKIDFFNGILKINEHNYLLVNRLPITVNNVIVEDQDKSAKMGKLNQLLEQYVDLWQGKPIGRTDVVKHQISLYHRKPICCGPRKYSQELISSVT